MQIGEPLRTVIVEPLEVPMKQPTREPEPVTPYHRPNPRKRQQPGEEFPTTYRPLWVYRVWRWDETGLKSLNGETWLPGQHLEARCRVAPAAHHMAEAVNEVPHRKCTCGIYAAKNSEHLRQIGYADGGILRRSLSVGYSGRA